MSDTKVNAIDLLNSKLDQALSMLICAAHAYEDEENGFIVPDRHLYNTIWAATENLREAQKAFNELFDERNAATAVPLRGAA